MTQHANWPGRTWLPVAVAVTGAMTLLAGCTADTPSDDGSVEPADTITLVTSFSGDSESPADLMAAIYEEQTGVHIEVRNLPPDSYDQIVRTELLAGNGADVIAATAGALFPTSVGPLVEAGMLEPISDPAVADVLTPGSEHLYTYDGEVYAAPTSILVTGLVVNDRALQAAGVAVPTTFEELLDSCGSFTGGSALIGVAGVNPASTAVLVAELAANYVYAEDRDWNEKRAAGEVTFADSEGWQQVFEAVEEMVAAGCFLEGAAGVGFEQMIGGIIQGSTAALPLPSLAASSLIRQIPGFEVSVHAFPALEGTDGLLIAGPSFGYAINAAADPSHKAAAQDFISWLVDPANASIVAEAEGGVPLSAVGGDGSGIPELFAPVADAIVAGDIMYLPSYDWTNPEVSSAMGAGVQALMTGQGTVRQALEAMDAAWQN